MTHLSSLVLISLASLLLAQGVSAQDCAIPNEYQGAGTCGITLTSGTSCSIGQDYPCGPNETRVGDRFTCQDGVFTEQSVCQTWTCQVTPAMLPANATYGTCQSQMAYNAQCELGCADGFTKSTPSISQCTGDNVFEVGTLQCVASICDLSAALGAPGVLNSNNCPISLNGTRATCNITCDAAAGYVLDGDDRFLCDHGTLVQSQTCRLFASCPLTAEQKGPLSGCPDVLAHNAQCVPYTQEYCESQGMWYLNGTRNVCNDGQLVETQRCDAQAPAKCNVTADMVSAFPGAIYGDQCKPELVPGEYCTLSCASGWDQYIIHQGLCTSTGAITLYDPICQPRTCTLSLGLGATMGSCAGSIGGADVECSIECSDGYELVGAKTRCSYGNLTHAQSCQSIVVSSSSSSTGSSSSSSSSSTGSSPGNHTIIDEPPSTSHAATSALAIVLYVMSGVAAVFSLVACAVRVGRQMCQPSYSKV